LGVSLAFGPDGNLYVANTRLFEPTGGGILRYNGHTGAFIDTFVAPGSGGLLNPLSVVFGPQGDLYVGSATTNSKLIASPGTSTVLRYDGTTGSFLGTFVTPDSGGLRYPAALLFSQTDPVTHSFDDNVVEAAGGATGPAVLEASASGRAATIDGGNPWLSPQAPSGPSAPHPGGVAWSSAEAGDNPSPTLPQTAPIPHKAIRHATSDLLFIAVAEGLLHEVSLGDWFR
jgi:hypothetical protein